jgi:pimeloyl-ACP methyl ester carboxylesterase
MQLVRQLESLGREVIGFDPPNSGRSTRPMRLDMPEMIGCALETLETCHLHGSLDVIGHSQSALAALAFALEHPNRVRRLILIGGAASGKSYLTAPGALWNSSHPEFWKLATLGIAYLLTRRKAVQDLMFNLIFRVSFVDQRHLQLRPVRLEDWIRAAHPRTRWAEVARHLDFRSRLAEVRAPTLVMVGRHDPQCPISCSQELARGIPNAQLVVFEQSGHSPFLEEPEEFLQTLQAFLEPVSESTPTSRVKRISWIGAGGDS